MPLLRKKPISINPIGAQDNTRERLILVHLRFPDADFAEDLEEFHELARATGGHEVMLVTGSRQKPDAKYFCGEGKAEEIKAAVAATHAELVIFNHNLTPSQERNLETLFSCRVIDRTGLILDIFASRARTFEGKLQVELAQLQHLSTRLVRGWTHLERQKGGIGLRGPGESQLETDRRLLRGRMSAIKQRLEKVRSQREQSRRARERSAIATVVCVGYTNAGKSTLFNSLTHSDVFSADLLFATLDPTLRRLELPSLGQVVLADTVGFIRHLPHDLVESFRATLEEAKEADLLLHVIDAANPRRQELMEQVNIVLQQIHADRVPQLWVYNKIDLLDNVPAHIDYAAPMHPQSVWVSALQQLGLPLLQQAIVELLSAELLTYRLQLPSDQGKLHAELHRLHAIVSENPSAEGGWELIVQLQRHDYNKLQLQRFA